MRNEQILIGATTALLCLIGLCREEWFLSETPKGQRLVRLLGQAKARWVLRALLLGGCAFGILLACDILSPIQWD